QKGAAAGFWNEDKAQALTKDAEQRIQKNHAQVKNREQKSLVTNALQLAGQNPLAAGAALSAEAGAGLPPEALTQIRNGVRSIQATAFAGARQEILDVILGSKAPAPGGVPAAIVTADDIAQLAENRLHPEETRALQETLTAHQSPQISAAMAHPDKLKETFGESLARLWSYDPEALGGPESKEARNEYAAIHTAASWLPERYRRDIGEELNGKWLGTAPVLDPSNKRYFADTLKELYASDVFGRREIRESAEDGGDRVIPDPGGLKQARTGLAEAMISLLQWDQENPRAPRQEAQAALYAACARQLSEHDAARVLDGSDELEAAATGFAA
ncbi:MAG TPA: hypothetical protein VHM91_08655, partial [Verrucomicrobiales bacterium]|nr:hypothetical protein [Verrucomicrobiales bacterium]